MIKDFIPYGHQDISKEDIESVVAVLKSDFLTQGLCVPEFENTVASYCGASHAVAVNSATSALHIAYLALGLSEGDLLWTTPITFVATANAARYCGAEVDFVDIDYETGNISISALEEKLKEARKTNGKLPKIVVPVHLCGLSCDMEEIRKLSHEFGFYIVEDASHAIGGEYKSKKVGSCEFSDIVVFSFHPVKIITTGEGGMILTNDTNIDRILRRLRSHGITRDLAKDNANISNPWYYEQIDLGFNYRLSDIHAALGNSQMRRIDEFVKKRNFLADGYNSLLEETALELPKKKSGIKSSFHLYVIKIDENRTNVSRKELFMYLREKKIGVQIHYIPVPTQPYYSNRNLKVGNYPQAIKYYENILTLPLFYGLSSENQLRVVSEIKLCLKNQ